MKTKTRTETNLKTKPSCKINCNPHHAGTLASSSLPYQYLYQYTGTGSPIICRLVRSDILKNFIRYLFSFLFPDYVPHLPEACSLDFSQRCRYHLISSINSSICLCLSVNDRAHRSLQITNCIIIIADCCLCSSLPILSLLVISIAGFAYQFCAGLYSLSFPYTPVCRCILQKDAAPFMYPHDTVNTY